jgi:hypothetical protein
MPLPMETERLLIRSFVRDDLDAFHLTLRSDPEVMRYYASPVATTMEDSSHS